MATTHRTFCRLCIAACGLQVEVDDTATTHRAARDCGARRRRPSRLGRVCLLEGPVAHRRARTTGSADGPLVRRADGELHPATWAEALADLDARLADVVATHGIDSVGFFTGGGAFTDAAAYWSAKRLQRRLGTKHAYSTMSIDAAAKYRVGEMVTGTAALTAHADPEAKLVLMIGTNPVVSHGQTPMFENPIERLRATARLGRRVGGRSAHHRDGPARQPPPRDPAGHRPRAARVPGARRARTAPISQRCGPGPTTSTTSSPRSPRSRSSEPHAVTGLAADDLTALLDAVHAAGRLAVLSGTGVTMNPGAQRRGVDGVGAAARHRLVRPARRHVVQPRLPRPARPPRVRCPPRRRRSPDRPHAPTSPACSASGRRR